MSSASSRLEVCLFLCAALQQFHIFPLKPFSNQDYGLKNAFVLENSNQDQPKTTENKFNICACSVDKLSNQLKHLFQQFVPVNNVLSRCIYQKVQLCEGYHEND